MGAAIIYELECNMLGGSPDSVAKDLLGVEEVGGRVIDDDAPADLDGLITGGGS